ncbi:quinolinate synthase NadA [Desulfovibrionales bacterium]
MNHASALEHIRHTLGKRLAILAHHYESDDIVCHADILGDSLELARKIDGLDAEYIVFCGVHFMAETAAILTRPGQQVYFPDLSAGCVMANMIPPQLVEAVLLRLRQEGARIIPLTYVNSPAAVKAICGRYGGSVCTSANAATMLAWALDQADGVLFLPDANLGRNTARTLGLSAHKQRVVDVRQTGAHVAPADADTQLYLWPGLCAVHAKFKTGHIQAVRSADPFARILVHPECAPEVVEMADGAGSTSYLIGQTAAAPAGAHLAIGTEFNLVQRLAQQYPDKHISPLRKALCSNMAKITPAKLLHTLHRLGTATPVQVREDIASPARLALERMLAVCS